MPSTRISLLETWQTFFFYQHQAVYSLVSCSLLWLQTHRGVRMPFMAAKLAFFYRGRKRTDRKKKQAWGKACIAHVSNGGQDLVGNQLIFVVISLLMIPVSIRTGLWILAMSTVLGECDGTNNTPFILHNLSQSNFLSLIAWVFAYLNQFQMQLF